MSRFRRGLARALAAALLAALAFGARAQEVSEYRLKAAFVFNFMAFTEWNAAAPGTPLNLCLFGADPFGGEIDGLNGKAIQSRSVAVQRKTSIESLRGCHAVFVAASAMEQLPRVLDTLRGQSVLTIADTPGAMRRGVMLNMNVAQGKVTFEANLAAARAAQLALSSRMLSLATEVQQ